MSGIEGSERERESILDDLDDHEDLVHRLRQHDAVNLVDVIHDFDGPPVYLTVELNHTDTTQLNSIIKEWGLRIGLAEVTRDCSLRINLGVAGRTDSSDGDRSVKVRLSAQDMDNLKDGQEVGPFWIDVEEDDADELALLLETESGA